MSTCNQKFVGNSVFKFKFKSY